MNMNTVLNAPPLTPAETALYDRFVCLSVELAHTDPTTSPEAAAHRAEAAAQYDEVSLALFGRTFPTAWPVEVAS